MLKTQFKVFSPASASLSVLPDHVFFCFEQQERITDTDYKGTSSCDDRIEYVSVTDTFSWVACFGIFFEWF